MNGIEAAEIRKLVEQLDERLNDPTIPDHLVRFEAKACMPKIIAALSPEELRR